MKRTFFYIFLVAVALCSVRCAGDLDIDSKTKITIDDLYSTPEGLHRAVTGLHRLHRNYMRNTASEQAALQLLDYNTDLMVFRAGTVAHIARLADFQVDNGVVAAHWKHYYQIIAKSNEVIYHAERMGVTEPDANPQMVQAYGEAKTFRAYAYFQLWQRFERLYLNLEPTTIENFEGRVYRAAPAEDIFKTIKDDLKDAIAYLDWVVPGEELGRFTRAVAKHIRAEVAMWEEDWPTAITQCEEIFANPSYGMMPRAIDVFTGANMDSREILWALPFSPNPGGANPSEDGADMVGHQLSLITTPSYKSEKGLMNAAEFGGYGWGRVYPNRYLLGKYDSKDKRRQELFREGYTYNDPEGELPAGSKLGDPFIMPTKRTATYLTNLHLQSMKYFDEWTNKDNPGRMSSFKDIPIYRLAQTYLMACEARFHRDGGGDAKAIEYYNKTWYREGNTGNDLETGPLTLEMILSEQARECHFEGVRWATLKRLGLLADRIKYAGDLMTDDPLLDKDYAEARGNFKPGKHERWPIPSKDLSSMPGYGQNEGWN